MTALSALVLATLVLLGGLVVPSFALTRPAPNHIILEFGADAWQNGDTWLRQNDEPPDIVFAKAVEPASANGGARIMEASEVLQGNVEAGDRFDFSERFGFGQSDNALLLGDASRYDELYSCSYIPLENVSVDEARAVVQAALKIQKAAPFERTQDRRKALIEELTNASTERVVAWMTIFPRWLETAEILRAASPIVAETFRKVIELELESPIDRDMTPATRALSLCTVEGAPALPTELLLGCLDQRRNLHHDAAELLGRVDGKDRDKVIAKMRAMLKAADEGTHCGAMVTALAELGATEAVGEIRRVAETNQFTYERQYALVALSKLDPKDAGARILSELRGIRVFGSNYILELSERSGEHFKSHELVPYLVSACEGLDLISFGDNPVIDWLQNITGLESREYQDYRKWWDAHYREKTWPIKRVRVHGEGREAELGNIEFVVE